jgi:hypothetical protein
MFNFIKRRIPSGDNREILAASSWAVRWRSRYGAFSADLKEECVFFPNKAEADDFADQLRKAFVFIKNTSDNRVIVEESGKP